MGKVYRDPCIPCKYDEKVTSVEEEFKTQADRMTLLLELEAVRHTFNLCHTICWKDNRREKVGVSFLSLLGGLDYQPQYPHRAPKWISTGGEGLNVKLSLSTLLLCLLYFSCKRKK